MTILAREVNALPWQKRGNSLSVTCFVALFPAFFVYHYAIAASIIPPFVGGWFGATSIVVTLLFLPFWMRCLVRLRQDAFILFLVTSILFGLVAFWLVIHYLFGSEYQARQDVVMQVGTVLLQWFSLFMIGLYWPERSPMFRVALWVSLALMAVIILTHLNVSNLMFDARRLWGNDQSIATYQGFARSLTFTGFALLAITMRPSRQLLLIAGLCILVFFCGARSEFLGFLLIMPLVLWVGFRRSRRWMLVAVLVVMFGVVAATANLEILLASRQLQFLDQETWSSYQARQTLQESGLTGTLNSPILGDYAGHVRDFGSTGSYIHNVLSAWQQFGLLTFILYFWLTLVSFWIAFKHVILGRQNGSVAIMALYNNAFCLLMIIAAKSVFWAPVALGWGLAVAVLVRSNSGSVGTSGYVE